MRLVIFALDNDRTVKFAKKVTARIGQLNPGVDRSISAEGWRNVCACAVYLTERIPHELLKAVLTVRKLLPTPAGEIVWREALTKGS